MADMYCWCGGLATPLACVNNPYHNPMLMVDPDPRRLYLLGPQDNRTDESMFVSASEYLRFVEYDVIWSSSLVRDLQGENKYKKKAMVDLLECDGVALLDGWWTCSEALTFALYAGSIDLPLRPVSEWVALAMPCNVGDVL
jgi:hypothetical protein